jgi:iron complex outermembrane receptor protein
MASAKPALQVERGRATPASGSASFEPRAAAAVHEGWGSRAMGFRLRSLTDATALSVAVFCVSAAAASAQEALPTIDIGAEAAAAPRSGEAGKGEASGLGPVVGYVADRSVSGTKTDTPLRRIPQAITVVGRPQMVDQGVTSLQEALRYAPGVVSDLYGLDTRTDSIAIRGQEATVNFLDGMRRFYGYYVNAGRIEPYTLERIEVLRGPSSVLYGQSGVGGAVNMVSKLPSAVARQEFTIEYGTFQRKELRFDVTGPVTPDGSWLYRLIGLGRDANTQVDHVADDRLLIAPAITYAPSNATSVTLLAQVSRDRSGSTAQFLPHEGTLYPGPYGRLPRNRFVGEPNFDRYNVDARSATLLVDQKLDARWSFHQGFRYANTHVVYGQIYPYIPDRREPFFDTERRLISRDVYLTDTRTSTITSDSNVSGELDVGPTEHKVLAGFDYSRADERQDMGYASDYNFLDLYAPTYGRLQLYDPYSGELLSSLPMSRRPTHRQSQAGLYVQDQLRFGPWIAVLGLRQDWTRNIASTSEQAQALTKRAGLMYEFDFGLTPYASYAESFVPVSGTDFANAGFKPLAGRSFELGFKYQLPDTSFVVNGAIYDAVEKNRLQIDPDHPAFSIQNNARAHLRGFELEAKGDVTPEIKLIVGYSMVSAKYRDGDQAGYRVESIPQHQASGWATYTFRNGPLQGLSFGGGVRYVGASWDGYDTVRTPDYTLFDGMAAFEFENWRWSLNASNIGDRYYMTTCLNRGDCFLGARRRIVGALTLKF